MYFPQLANASWLASFLAICFCVLWVVVAAFEMGLVLKVQGDHMT